MFSEDDLLPISALQHLLFCPRQCALIHIERLWAENPLTLEGRHLHDKTDRGRPENRPGVRIVRSMPLRSLRLGLFGVADVVEFHDGAAAFPVEFKRGRPKSHDADRVQICAQALCLEEMLASPVQDGALFYGKTRRRVAVSFDAGLRQLTEETAQRLHELFQNRRTPPAIREKKCERCSLLHLCLPEALSQRATASRYLAKAIDAALAGGPPGE